MLSVSNAARLRVEEVIFASIWFVMLCNLKSAEGAYIWYVTDKRRNQALQYEAKA